MAVIIDPKTGQRAVCADCKEDNMDEEACFNAKDICVYCCGERLPDGCCGEN